ncbi:hypothetical protein FRB99_002149 [Tulasnella sp. 403]|nr:hypothetical protein FRB99_002149 [Tulasnella sp. 403]
MSEVEIMLYQAQFVMQSRFPNPTTPPATIPHAMAPTTVKEITATMKNAATNKVWPVLEDLIRIADAADIPVCGGVFGALTFLIDSFDEVKDNKAAYGQLETTLARSVKDLKDFVSVLPATYLSDSSERHAVIARDAIKTFDRRVSLVALLYCYPILTLLALCTTFKSDLECLRNLLKEQAKQNKRNRLSRLTYRTKIKGDIDACMAQLERSHQAFRDAVSKVVAGSVTRVLSGGEPYDEWKITGAKCLPPHAIGQMKPAPSIPNRGRSDVEFVQAEVDGVVRVVKLFRGRAREKVFLDALRFFQEHRQVHTL